MTRRAKSQTEGAADSGAEILQFKIRLKGVSPLSLRLAAAERGKKLRLQA